MRGHCLDENNFKMTKIIWNEYGIWTCLLYTKQYKLCQYINKYIFFSI